MPEATVVNVPDIYVEDADSEASPITAEAVNLRCFDRVVDLHSFQHLVRYEVDYTSNESDHCGCPLLDVVAGGGDSDEASENRVQESGRVMDVLAVLQLVPGHLDEEEGQCRSGRRDERVDCNRLGHC